MEKSWSCPICHAKEFSCKFFGKDYFYHTNNDKTYKIIECSNCKLECIYPIPDLDEQKSFYPSNYYSYQNKKDFKRMKSISFISKIGKKLGEIFDDKELQLPKGNGNGKRFLDIGCGEGINLEIMNERGWNSDGFEIGNEMLYKNNIYYGNSIVDVNFGKKYDFIWCHHVFEHVCNPIDFLKKCHSLLEDNGRLVLSLPNVKSFSSKIWGKYSADRDIPRHLFGYNYNNIQKLFIDNGFKIIYKNYQQNYGGLLSFSWYIYDKYGKDISNNFLFKGIFLFLDLILSLFKPTNSMGFVLRKS